MTRIALLLVVVSWGLLAAPVRAQIADSPELPGSYLCTGQSADGKPYAGTVEIVAHEGGRFEVRWTFVGPNDEEARIMGIGIVTDGKLSVAYFAGYPGVVVYAVEKVNPLTLKGQWAIPPAPGIYPETLSKLPAGHPSPAAPKRKALPKPTHQA